MSTHLDTGARALDALSPEEAASFDAHLATCATCQLEYDEFVETVALLGAAVAEPAPASLRESLMTLIDRTPQSPPPDSASPVQPTAATPLPPVTATPLPPVAESSSSPPEERVGRAPWYRRPTTLMMAAVLAALAVTGAIVLNRNNSDVPMTAAQCLTAASDVQVLQPTTGTGGSVRYSASCRAAEVTTPDMPTLPSDQDYQLWLMADDSATPEGLVAPTTGSRVVQVGANDTTIGVSIEPSGGSQQPTSDPIWVVPLSS